MHTVRTTHKNIIYTVESEFYWTFCDTGGWFPYMVTRDVGDISLNFDNRICSKPAWVVWSWAVVTVCNVWGRFYVVKKVGVD